MSPSAANPAARAASHQRRLDRRDRQTPLPRSPARTSGNGPSSRPAASRHPRRGSLSRRCSGLVPLRHERQRQPPASASATTVRTLRHGMPQCSGASTRTGTVAAIDPLAPFAAGQTGVPSASTTSATLAAACHRSGQQVTVIWESGSATPTLLPVLDTDPGSFVQAWQDRRRRPRGRSWRPPATRSTATPRSGPQAPPASSGSTSEADRPDERLGPQVRCRSMTRADRRLRNVSGEQRAFLRTPMPEPSTLSALGVMLLGRSRRIVPPRRRAAAVAGSLAVAAQAQPPPSRPATPQRPSPTPTATSPSSGLTVSATASSSPTSSSAPTPSPPPTRAK